MNNTNPKGRSEMKGRGSLSGDEDRRWRAGVLWRPANSDEMHQRVGARAQCVGGSCPRSRTSTGGKGRRGQGHERTMPFGRDVPVLAVASSASASAGEGSKLMSRGWWCDTAVVGELWLEHAPNRGTGATQSASNACQAPCPHAVTALALPKRRPNAAKPCLG